MHTTAGHQQQTSGDDVNKRKITSSPERDYLHNTFSIPKCEIDITPNPVRNSSQANSFLTQQAITYFDGKMLKKDMQFLAQSITLTAKIPVQLMLYPGTVCVNCNSNIKFSSWVSVQSA